MIFNSYAEQKEELAGIRLVSCGHVFAEPNREIYRPHGREDWLLFYVAKESETFYFDREITAEAGTCILFSPGEKQHHIYKGSKTAEFYYVHFTADALPRDLTLPTSTLCPLPPSTCATAVFEEIIEETLQKRAHYETLCISRLLYLLATIRRETAATATSRNKEWHSVARAIQHMNRYFDQSLSLEEYAAMCCMSKYHFLRLFKAVTGTTPMEYRTRIRIDHAKELLQNSYYSVYEIAAALGYASLAYFSTAFRRATGLSPTEYKLAHTEAKP